MHFYLGILLIAFGITSALMVPYINLLFRMKFTRKSELGEERKTATKQFEQIRKMHAHKVGMITGGGILVGLVVAVMFVVVTGIRGGSDEIIAGYPWQIELMALFFTFVGYGLLGLYDDIIKIFGYKKGGFFGLRMRHKFMVQWLVGFISAGILFFGLGIDFVNIPGLGIVDLGWLYFPMAAGLVVWFANAFDFTDGLDGLSCGLLMICLMAFLVISITVLDQVMGIFISIWLGALMAFLYFNIYPARIMLGNAGGLAFGATLAVIGLLSGKIVALLIIAGVFMVEGLSSLLQLFSKRFMKRRLFPIAPIHHWLQLLGWEEPKIVARAWLVGLVLAIFGVWLAVL